MILSASSNGNLDEALDKIGMEDALRKSKSVLIKVNIARPPEPGHPRTDAALLAKVIQYLAGKGAACAIAEGADGFLWQNLERAGLKKLVQENQVKVIDLDLEEFDSVAVEDEEHYLPRCLRDYTIRIGVPALSKRPGMTFSNNVKLFVGAVPRRMYQIGEATTWRPRVHIDLHRSVANIYRAVMRYAAFGFYVNGGKAMIEGQGEIASQVLVGNNALELDRYLLKQFNIEEPEYIARLAEMEPSGSSLIK
jgi:uncharacterized protein (DUF362 family)